MRHVTAVDPTNGILDFRHALQRFRLERLAPAAELQPWIEGYWVVSWELPDGQVHRQTNLSHASINAAFEPEGAFLYGVPDRTFVRDISGCGWAFGVKFRPGAFFPFYGAPLSSLTGTRVPFELAFGQAGARWTQAMRRASTPEERARATDAFWRARRPARAPGPAAGIAGRIISDRSILTAAQAAAGSGLTVRSLQRLFQREVGIGPKEVIRRFRLQEAAERLLREPGLACGDLAQDLGYFDQAHFIRDFREVVGVTPEVYRRRQ
jgi:AraC-like DNA-binding protein